MHFLFSLKGTVLYAYFPTFLSYAIKGSSLKVIPKKSIIALMFRSSLKLKVTVSNCQIKCS